MAIPGAVIVEVAVNGATTRAVNPNVPRTPDEIAADMLAAAQAGAAILHNHNDEPMFTPDGVHAAEPYEQAWRLVRAERPDVLLYPTMAAGARGIPVARRWAHVARLARTGGMTLIDPGSVNVGLTADGRCPPEAAAQAYANTVGDVEYMCARTADLGAAPSVSIFEPGFLRTALTLHRHGRLPRGALLKLYFGGDLQFGLPPTPTALEAYLELIEPSGLPWSVAVLGGDVVASGLAEHALRRGGHVRVGLEDWARSGGAGPDAPSNATLLDGLLALLDRLGTRPATPREARALLGAPA